VVSKDQRSIQASKRRRWSLLVVLGRCWSLVVSRLGRCLVLSFKNSCEKSVNRLFIRSLFRSFFPFPRRACRSRARSLVCVSRDWAVQKHSETDSFWSFENTRCVHRASHPSLPAHRTPHAAHCAATVAARRRWLRGDGGCAATVAAPRCSA